MIKEFFYFPKSDRRAMIFLLAVVVLSAVVVGIMDKGGMSSQLARTDSLTADSSIRKAAVRRGVQYIYNVETVRRKLSAFDPNTADSTLLLSLGLQPWQVRSIYRYRAKGGIYRQPSDFARLYGLTVKQYKELLPYIHISDEYKPAAEVYGRTDAVRSGRDTLRYPVKLQPGQYVTLDDADTASLRKVPGIGRYYASRIVRYRNDLGGYVSVAQLSEIEGIPEAALSYFRVTGGAVRKLNLNRLTLNELKHHPYINFYQARRIIDYRRLKGPLHSIDDLRLLKDFSQRDIERLRPYVEF
ncbi:ComEA family DNA-binding protein [Leyella lascolaii]|jgi:DNA uptake protein ComE-like DNA-binding protein|uniref:ComEA family DNA-binding protein n=1 Tax=Leyella lascolaii TaxID=1776379 RepID=UPI0023541BAA|nr:helix-hairpin-helix domain-containing protein [Leyella lascolaii]